MDRRELIDILIADQEEIDSLVCTSPKKPSQETARDFIDKLWVHVRHAMAEIVADRLLDPNASGLLLDHAVAKQTIVRVAKDTGSFRSQKEPPFVEDAFSNAYADFVLSFDIMVNLHESVKQRIERLEVICGLARSYGIRPLEFLRQVPNAQDWILRLTSTPDGYREQWRISLNSLHPDRVQHSQRFFHEAAKRCCEVERVHLNISFHFPSGDEYWKYRAFRLQKVEERIVRVWGDCGNLMDV